MTAITRSAAPEVPSTIGMFSYVATIAFSFMMMAGVAFYLFYNLPDA